MDTLIKVLRRALNNELEKGLLYLPEDEDWTADSPAMILDVDNMDESQMDFDDEPLVAKEKNLTDTLDDATIIDIVEIARRDIQDPPSDGLLFEAFFYYYCLQEVR